MLHKCQMPDATWHSSLLEKRKINDWWTVSLRLAAVCLSLALLDIPLIFWLRWQTVPLSFSPGSAATAAEVVYALCIVLVAMSLCVWLTWAVTLTLAGALFLLIQHAGLFVVSSTTTPILLLLLGVGAHFLVNRIGSLMRRILRETRSRKKLGRYIPPTCCSAY